MRPISETFRLPMALSVLHAGALYAQTALPMEGEIPPWTFVDTILLIILILLVIAVGLAVYASLLHLKKDIATTGSTLKKIVLTPLFIFLLLLALCLLPLMLLYWWLHPLLAKSPESAPTGKIPHYPDLPYRRSCLCFPVFAIPRFSCCL